MTQSNANPQKPTHGRYLPRQFNVLARERFYRDRGRRYLGRIVGEPTDHQLALVQSMTRLEWAALTCEADGSLAALRDAREHRRLFQRLLDDFERTLVVAPSKPGIAEILAAIHKSGTAA